MSGMSSKEMLGYITYLLNSNQINFMYSKSILCTLNILLKLSLTTDSTCCSLQSLQQNKLITF